MRRTGGWLWAYLTPRVEPDPMFASYVDAALHVEADLICPDCLHWIDSSDHVRRNGVGMLEHEMCPPLASRRPPTRS